MCARSEAAGRRAGSCLVDHSEVFVMRTRVRTAAASVAAAALIYLTIAAAQSQDRGPTLDDRVGLLERSLASLATRFELRDSASPPAAGGALEPRISALETALDRLAVDLQRVERQAENAQREASDARREAASAERAARDVAMRAR
jgi:hypothetical protein